MRAVRRIALGILAALLLSAVFAFGAGAGTARDAPLAATPAAHAAPGELTVVGLGDSVTAGTACGCTDFVQLYAQRVSTSAHPVTADNDGVPGLTSSGLVSQLQSQADVRDDVRHASVVLITIGANDLSPLLDTWRQSGCDSQCESADLPAMQANIERAIAEVQALRAGQSTQIAVTTYWNVFIDGQVAVAKDGPEYLAWSDQLTRLANQAICRAAQAEAGVICVDLYTPFKGDGTTDPTPLLAPDGDHPDAAGHEKIARALAAAIPLTS